MTKIDPRWAELEVGDYVTVLHKESNSKVSAFIYNAGAGYQNWTFLLGWPIRKASGMSGLGVRHFELLDVTKAPRPKLPETDGSIVSFTDRIGTIEAVLVGGAWLWVDDGERSRPETWLKWTVVRDAGEEPS